MVPACVQKDMLKHAFLPAQTLHVLNFLICRQKPPNFVTFPKSYLGTIFGDISLFIKSDVSCQR